jgi:hypothetical protein
MGKRKCDRSGCGRSFEPRKGGRPQRFCSEDCRLLHHAHGNRYRQKSQKGPNSAPLEPRARLGTRKHPMLTAYCPNPFCALPWHAVAAQPTQRYEALCAGCRAEPGVRAAFVDA